MKKIILMLGLASAMSAFTGCTKDVTTENPLANGGKERQPITLVAKMADDGVTRTAMGANSAVWSAGDRIALYAEVSSSEHFLPLEISANDVGAATAGFTLDANYLDGWNETIYYPLNAPGIGQCVALYPHSTAFYFSPYAEYVRLGAAIPAVQQYAEGTFDNQALPMIAMSTETETGGVYTYSPMTFKYMAGLLHLTMTAAAPTEIEKIELTGSNGQTIAGNVVVSFLKTQPLNETFKAILQGGAGSLGSIGGNGLQTEGAPINSITLKGPINLSSTPSNAYFSVLPANYSGKTLMFTFHQADGLVTEKSLAGHLLNAGEIAQLPTFTYHIPFLPAVSVSDRLLATCTQDETVESYSAEIRNNGAAVDIILGNISTKSISFDPAVGIGIDTLKINNLKPGTHALQLVVKADFKDKSGVDAVYSVPVDFEFKALPAIPAIKYWMDNSMFQLSNFQTYWEKIDYAYVKKANATAEDFANVTFTTAQDVTSYVFLDNPPTEIGDYTLAVRVWHDTTDTVNGYAEGYCSFSISSTLPSVNLLDEVADYGDITIENWQEIKSGLPQVEYMEVCWVNGESTNFDNPLKTIYSDSNSQYFADSGDIYFIHIKNAIGAGNSGTYSALVKIWYDSNNPDGYVSASMTFTF